MPSLRNLLGRRNLCWQAIPRFYALYPTERNENSRIARATPTSTVGTSHVSERCSALTASVPVRLRPAPVR